MANNNTSRPTEIECIDMWERSNNAKEYEGLYDKAREVGAHIDEVAL